MGSPPVKGFGQGSPELAAWAERTFGAEDPVLAGIRARSAREGLPAIAVGAMDGLHLEVLARAAGARKAVEIGTLGGYSAVCLLRGLGEGGFLHTLELDPRRAEVARASLEGAGFAGRFAIHVGDALETLPRLEAGGPFDLVFVDADKARYPQYLAWAEEHLRVGGLLLADNAFAFGHVHDPEWRGDDAAAVAPLRRFAERLAGGGRFRATMLPTAEGLALGVKVR
jgi:caffeoyl-CoA O-methyltransferase